MQWQPSSLRFGVTTLGSAGLSGSLRLFECVADDGVGPPTPRDRVLTPPDPFVRHPSLEIPVKDAWSLCWYVRGFCDGLHAFDWRIFSSRILFFGQSQWSVHRWDWSWVQICAGVLILIGQKQEGYHEHVLYIYIYISVWLRRHPQDRHLLAVGATSLRRYVQYDNV